MVANLFKQAEGLAKLSSLGNEEGEISTFVASEIAKMTISGELGENTLLENQSLDRILTQSLSSHSPGITVDEEQVSSFSEILTSSNSLLADDELLDLNAEDMLKTLAQRQVTIEEEVINGIDDVLSGYTSCLPNY